MCGFLLFFKLQRYDFFLDKKEYVINFVLKILKILSDC